MPSSSAVPCYNQFMLTFAAAVQQSPLPLFTAGLCFAREIAYPGLDIPATLLQLDNLEQMARDASPPTHDDLARGQWLAQLLFHEWAFQGNFEEYTDPRNSYLNELLERRRGIPITLSVLYLALAERFAIPATGIGLPGHFIVAVRSQNKRLLLDPFHRGRELSLPDCARLVADTSGYTGSFQAEWLTPLAPQTILFRMLNNLRLIYLEQNATELALNVLTQMELLDPHNPVLIRDRGVLHYRRKQYRQALFYLDQYARLAPGAPDTHWLKQNLGQELTDWVRLN
ncbi:MAG: transglutaminase family protein [Chloroflexi bacterium]|nr:transglutaminase family protein [Chloroflexota bacterium]